MSKYPSDWLSKPLGTVYPKIVVGYVGNVNDHYCRAEEGVPFYRTLNIRDGYFRHSEHLYVTHEFNEKNKKSQIANNDILIARVGANLGMVCKANGISGLANMANAIIIKTNDVNSADADFYTSFLLSPMGKNQIYSGAAGGAQGVFNTKLTQEIIVPVPPLPEQQKIAKILSTWDKAIATTEKLIATSQQEKKALMQQLLTGKKRLVNPETGKVFEGDWERHTLSDLVHVDKKSLGKKTPDDFEFKYISLSDVATGTIGVNLEVHKYATAPSRARRVLQNGDVLLSTVRPNLKGFAKISQKHADCIASTGFSVLTPKKRVSGDYIYQYIFSSHVTGQIDSLVVGSNYPAINSSDVAGLKIYCPTYEEQQKIASVLTSADREIELLETKLAHLKQEKKALMQQLLTGKRRVKIEEMEIA